MLPKKWTGDLVGLMHVEEITFSMLAEELNVTNRYVSMVLNSHREPAGAEEKFRAAVDRIIERKNAGLSHAGEDAAPIRHAPHDTSPRGEASQQE